jgi:hypothetical protein
VGKYIEGGGQRNRVVAGVWRVLCNYCRVNWYRRVRNAWCKQCAGEGGMSGCRRLEMSGFDDRREGVACLVLFTSVT